MTTYSADAEFHPHLLYIPAGDHTAGELVDAIGWENYEIRGQIRQAAHTFAVLNTMNEYQVGVGETTWGGRRELRNPDGILDYDALIVAALQRSKTAREAILEMAKLAAEYGYGSSGESFSVSDPSEVWFMELIGRGPGVKGIIFVARRVPDGYISCHANMPRITTFPMDDPENCLYSEDVIDFAVEKGYYDPESGKPFSFCDAYYGKPGLTSLRVCAARVWSVYRRAAPSQNFSPNYHRGVEGAEDYPLFIKPDKKLTLQDVMALMRDHYEGTPFDMTRGVDAGPFNSPYRWRDLTWEVDEQIYCWERPISTQQTGFTQVTQARSWLPNHVGGIYWYGIDDAYFSCFIPLYVGITDVPKSFVVGDLQKFSWESAWWVFNFVANYSYPIYSRALPDVQKVQQELEGMFFELQPLIEKHALELAGSDPEALQSFLTSYCVNTGEAVTQRWRELGAYLLTKFNDGYVKDGMGRPRGIGYPEEWLRRVIGENPDQFKIPQQEEDH